MLHRRNRCGRKRLAPLLLHVVRQFPPLSVFLSTVFGDPATFCADSFWLIAFDLAILKSASRSARVASRRPFSMIVSSRIRSASRRRASKSARRRPVSFRSASPCRLALARSVIAADRFARPFLRRLCSRKIGRQLRNGRRRLFSRRLFGARQALQPRLQIFRTRRQDGDPRPVSAGFRFEFALADRSQALDDFGLGPAEQVRRGEQSDLPPGRLRDRAALKLPSRCPPAGRKRRPSFPHDRPPVQ